MNVGSIIIVTFNSAESIDSCLRALICEEGWERLVIDNASADRSVERVRMVDAGAHIVENAENRGFGAAANQGARLATGRILLFLNPDAVPRPGALQALAAELDQPGVGAVGGGLLREDGRPDRGFSVRRFPTTAAMAAEILMLNRFWPGNPVNWHYRCADLDYARTQDVDQPAGACLAVRRDAWDSVGGFDEMFFPVWFEDVDLCLRLRERGWRIVYSPRGEFVHSGGHSVNQVQLSDRQAIWYRNMLRYFRKHRGALAVSVLRACIVVGMGLRSTAAMLGFGPRDVTPIEAVRAYFRVVRECVFSADSLGGNPRP